MVYKIMDCVFFHFTTIHVFYLNFFLFLLKINLVFIKTNLVLIIMASQRIESWDNVFADDASNRKERRGPSPTPIELMIVLYVAGERI